MNASDAAEFVDAGTEAGLVLAGVEGFSITDLGAYQPRQEFSNDYADFRGSLNEFVIETKALILCSAAAGIRFEVIFEDEP